MISLSRLIKSNFATPLLNQNKVISIKKFHLPKEEQVIPIEKGPTKEEINQAIKEAEKKAEQIIQEANDYAQSTKIAIEEEIKRLNEEAVQIAEEAKAQGYEDGLQQGRKRGYEEVQQLITEARQIVHQSKEDYLKKIESSEGMILQIGLSVAEKILGEELAKDEEIFLPIVKRAMKEVREAKEVQIQVNPSQYPLLIDKKDELLSLFPREVSLYIYPNGELGENDCIIESDHGRIDASVDQQLTLIKEKLFELLESE